MKKLLCPSMMCADFGDLSGEVERLEQAGADMLHLDLMDGAFVPNYGMGMQDIQFIASKSKLPCDIHMMAEHPDRFISVFAKMGIKVIYIHPETDPHAPRTLQAIADAGAQPGIAINPGTAFSTIEPLLPLCDYVLAMTVNPGFAGQRFLPLVEDKLRRLTEAKQEYGYHLIIDGACSPQVIARESAAGVDGFVLGTSALFGKGRPYSEIMSELRNL